MPDALPHASVNVGRKRFARAVWAATLGCLSCGCPGCSATHVRPPYADDEADSNPDAAVVAEPEPLLNVPDETDNACRTTIELPVVRPNFYIVLDSSASMLEWMPGQTEQTRYDSALSAISDMLRSVQTRVNFGAAVFPAPIGAPSCEAGEEVFKLRSGDGTDGSQMGPALRSLLRALERNQPDGGTPISPTIAALRKTLLNMSGPTFVFLLTDGAPNCNPDNVCEADQCILNLEQAHFDNGLVCDASFNCCAEDVFPHLCLDRDATVDELGQLADAGVPSYVIGMPGSSTYASVLDSMAQAAGTAQTDGDTQYYRVDDAQALVETLTELSTQILIECTLPLNAEPRAVNLVQVLAGEELLPNEAWQWVDAQTIELLGATCQRWQAGELPRIRVEERCSGEVR